jgi:hypothetical protein
MAAQFFGYIRARLWRDLHAKWMPIIDGERFVDDSADSSTSDVDIGCRWRTKGNVEAPPTS